MTSEELIDNWELFQYAISLDVNDHSSPALVLMVEMLKSRKLGRATERLGEIFIDISAKIVNRFNVTDDVRQDLIQSGALDALQYYHKFNEYRSNNPYSYIIQIIKSGHAKGYRKLCKHLPYEIERI